MGVFRNENAASRHFGMPSNRENALDMHEVYQAVTDPFRIDLQ